MFNPFRKSYRIVEFKNQKGETKFAATYSSLIQRIFANIERMAIYINDRGFLVGWERDGEYSSLDLANQAVQKHKSRAIDEFNAKYKKSAIHYVE